MPRKYAPANECVGHDVSSRTRTKVCRLGDTSSKRLIVLLGDSHAMMWLPALVEMTRRDHWALVPLLRLGCTPAKWTSAYGSDACRGWYSWALGQIQRLHPKVTLVTGNVAEEDTALTRAGVDGLVTAAGTLRRSGPVVVIGDPEGLHRDPVDCVLSPRTSMATCTTTWPASSLAPYDEVQRRAVALGAGFLGTRGFLCFQHRCPAVIGRTIAWADTNHVSAAYVTRIAGPFGVAFTRALARSRR